jgi:cysteine desulfurase/selenocysteine lyase
VGAILLVIPINDLGEILLSEYEKLLTPKTKFVSLVHVSNALGTINPIKEMIKLAHAKKIPVLIDGAQAAPHFKIDVQDLDCDFYVFSGHKMYGPTGIGVLFGKKELLDRMPPYQGGGDMIVSVSFEKTQYNVLPFKFEAGTPNIVGAIGLGVAIEYLQSIGMEAISEYEKNLLNYATEKLSAISGIRLIGQASQKASVLSFLFKGVHPHDIGTILDREGIAIRAGHHCTQPLMQRLGIPATARASFSFYNTKEEIDRLCLAIEKVREVFADV